MSGKRLVNGVSMAGEICCKGRGGQTCVGDASGFQL